MTEIAGVTKPSSLRAVLQTFRRGRPTVRPRPSHIAAGRSDPVSRELSRLGPRWRVLDDVAAGRRGRLDHLVIGPGGVFAVTGQHEARNTICLGGQSLLVGSDRIHHGRLSRDDAQAVATRLTESVGFAVPVTALVLIVGDRRFVVPRQPDDAVVRLATPSSGVRWMRRRRAALTASVVDRIYAAASEPATWALMDAATRHSDR
jgi:hypothetical protein